MLSSMGSLYIQGLSSKCLRGRCQWVSRTSQKMPQRWTSVLWLCLQTAFVSITPSPLSVYFMVTRIAQVWSWGPCHVLGLPSKHGLLAKIFILRLFIHPSVSNFGDFQILCETDFDCRLLQSLNGLFVDPFDSRRRPLWYLVYFHNFDSSARRLTINDTTFIWRCLWLVTI